MENLFSVPQGDFELNRLPSRRRELLRAWDAADEYLLNHLAESRWPDSSSRILIVNDSFGALAVALHVHKPLVWSDSYLSQEATRRNFAANALPPEDVGLLTSLDTPNGIFDLVLIKAPKTLALLEDELLRLRPHVGPTTKIIVAGMIKGLSSSVWRLLEKTLGPTSTSLAWKKARLIFVEPNCALTVPENPYPVEYRLEGTEFIIVNHANVFSRDSLDIGTRFFLAHLVQWPKAKDIIDLGCGNGVVGLIAARDNSEATLHFVDESFMAVASARENFRLAFDGERQATFRAGDCLTDFADGSADIVLCNPPFHQQAAVGDMIAQKMFKQAKNVLRAGGELWVIGNRHLGYHQTLGKLFGRVSLVASNAKFVIFKAVA
ncbi:MAG: methyltransferase [Gammaproteobacteria bacterium]